MTASGTSDEEIPRIVTHDHQAELPSAASGARWGRFFHSLGASMLRVELRQMFRTNGLIDDFVVYGDPEDYVQFSEKVRAAISSSAAVVVKTDSAVRIEISKSNESEDLFTSLQNESDEYFSIEAWNARSILRVIGSKEVLAELSDFLIDISGRGKGYSYISEFSKSHKYSALSPEWRLHVQDT